MMQGVKTTTAGSGRGSAAAPAGTKGKAGDTMKKTGSLLLALLLCVGFCGCGAAQTATEPAQPQTASTTTAPATTAQPTTTAPATTEPTTTKPPVFSPDDVAMTATPNSSCFSEVGYSDAFETLVVRFRDSGKRYCYSDVPASVWAAFWAADSLGRYYNTSIKGKYACEPG